MATKVKEGSPNSRAISDLLPKGKRMKLEASYFPNISRFITERKLLLWLISIVIVSFGVLVSFRLLSSAMKQYQIAAQKKQGVEKQLLYWQGAIKNHPDYRDGYVMAAVLEYELNDQGKAVIYMQQAQKLDPNNQTLEHMTQTIEKY